MNGPPGILAALRQRLCPTWAALGAVVLLGFLATASVHDHADDAPGTTAIHCPVAAAPLVAPAQASALPVDRDPPVVLADRWAPALTCRRAVIASPPARAPPAGHRTSA